MTLLLTTIVKPAVKTFWGGHRTGTEALVVLGGLIIVGELA